MTSGERRSIVACVALACLALGGCSEQQFAELMLTLAFGFVVAVLATLCMSVLSLTLLGGGVATIAINLFGQPTHRARTLGFVFGGLNTASGLTGAFGALAAMFVFHAELTAMLTPESPAVDPASAAAAPDLFMGGLVSLAVSAASLALGIGGIAAAARAKPVDLVPRGEAGPPPAP